MNFLKAKGLNRKDIPRDDESLYSLLAKNLAKHEIMVAIKKCDGKCPKNSASKKAFEKVLVQTLLHDSESSDTSSVASEETENSNSTEVKIEKVSNQSKIDEKNASKTVIKSGDTLCTPTRKRIHTIISPDTEETTPSKKNIKHSLAKMPDTLSDNLFKFEDFKIKAETIAKVISNEKGEKKIHVKRSHFAALDHTVKYAIMIDVEEKGTNIWGYRSDIMQILYQTLGELNSSIGFLKHFKSYPFVSPEGPSVVACDSKGYARSFIGGVIEIYGTTDEAQVNFQKIANIVLDIHKRRDFPSIYLESIESSGSSDKFYSFVKKNVDKKTGIGDLTLLKLHTEIDVSLDSYYLRADANRLMEDLFGSNVGRPEHYTDEQKSHTRLLLC